MPCVAFTVPLLPGQTDAHRVGLATCWLGGRREAYRDARRRAGITREAVWVQFTSDGHVAVVYLEAEVETLLERLAGDLGRPLLRGGDREAVVRELLSRRVPGYRTADVTFGTDGRTVEEVAGQVADWIERTEGRAG